jgi:DNA repair protein RecN (Recombination protein N)
MLVQLSIRDIVLIDRLDIDFAPGPVRAHRRDRRRQVHPARRLRAGARPRGDASLVRQGAEQGQVTASSTCALEPPARARARGKADIAWPTALILRRVQFADGRTRAFVNDQPVSVQALRASAPRWSRSTASTTTARWSTPPPTARCSTPSAGSKPTSRPRVARLRALARGAAPRWRPRRAESSARARGRLAAPRRRGADEARPRAGEETELADRRAPA